MNQQNEISDDLIQAIETRAAELYPLDDDTRKLTITHQFLCLPDARRGDETIEPKVETIGGESVGLGHSERDNILVVRFVQSIESMEWGKVIL